MKIAMNYLQMAMFVLILAAISRTEIAQAYPDNVRLGYTSCASCHVSPTGGGLLTSYGRKASIDFMGTWFEKGEADFLHGAVTTPDWLNAGGDVRILGVQKDNKAFTDKAAFPMQIEAEVAASLPLDLTVVVATGIFDETPQTQRHYVQWQMNENFFARVGRFFPAYGIYVQNHTVPTRSGLGFNEGRESYNVEAGMISEWGEVIIDAITKSGQVEISDEETGFSAKTALYLGKRSQVGLSLFSGSGTVWDRQIAGLFAIIGISEEMYYMAEIDQETKSSADSSDPTLDDNTRIVTLQEFGVDLFRGFKVYASYESSQSTKGSFDPKTWKAGPGIQWFPRPHFELVGQALQAYDSRWSNKAGYELTLMGHYYL